MTFAAAEDRIEVLLVTADRSGRPANLLAKDAYLYGHGALFGGADRWGAHVEGWHIFRFDQALSELDQSSLASRSQSNRTGAASCETAFFRTHNSLVRSISISVSGKQRF